LATTAINLRLPAVARTRRVRADLSIFAPVLRLLNRKNERCTGAGRMNALRQLGPYVAIELILPGGSLIALALWLYRRYRQRKVLFATTSALATSTSSWHSPTRYPVAQWRMIWRRSGVT
jgi:hypothetical protein